MPDQGDIVLIPVPFTDLSSHKRRPVIVISNDAYNQASPDVIVVAMTSNPAAAAHSCMISSADLVQGALNRPGIVRVDKIYTLAKAIVVRKFAKVSPTILARIRATLESLVTSSP
jgi:mRNA interferase MazF